MGYWKNHLTLRSELSKKIWANPERRKKLGITQSKRLTPEVRRKQGISKQKSWTPELGAILSRQITLGRNRQHAEKKCKVFYESLKGNYQKSDYAHLKEKQKQSNNLIPYKTQWQLTAFKKLDENPLVKNWNFLTIAIQFKDLARKKFSHIAIDLEVFYTDNTKKLILIRPNGFQLEHHEFNSLSYIEKYCVENRYSFEIWTKEAFTL
jgi:hypothetical protein